MVLPSYVGRGCPLANYLLKFLLELPSSGGRSCLLDNYFKNQVEIPSYVSCSFHLAYHFYNVVVITFS